MFARIASFLDVIGNLLSSPIFQTFLILYSCFFFSFPPSVWLYISAVLGGCFINGSIPLFYELTIETTYPIAEGIPMAVVTTSNHVACLLFLAALMIPGIGKSDGKLAPTSSVLFSNGNIAKKQY